MNNENMNSDASNPRLALFINTLKSICLPNTYE